MKNIFTFIALSISIVSCQKEIDVDLNEANPVIALEGNYSSEDSLVTLNVSLTSSYFDSELTPIDNLSPVIKDANGVSQSLISNGDGTYALTNYIPEYNSIYTMEVSYNGVLYSASSTLFPPVVLDTITYEFIPGFGDDIPPGYLSTVNFLDPVGESNFYLLQLSNNHEESIGFNYLVLLDDRFTDGNPISRPLFLDPLFQLSDTIGMELRSIDEVVYDYYTELLTIAGSQASAAPANPESNWNNDALGYFSAYSKSNQEVIVL